MQRVQVRNTQTMLKNKTQVSGSMVETSQKTSRKATEMNGYFQLAEKVCGPEQTKELRIETIHQTDSQNSQSRREETASCGSQCEPCGVLHPCRDVKIRRYSYVLSSLPLTQISSSFVKTFKLKPTSEEVTCLHQDRRPAGRERVLQSSLSASLPVVTVDSNQCSNQSIIC